MGQPHNLLVAYVVTNTVNGKQYVGITTKGASARWKVHLRQSRTGKGDLYIAIREHGADKFTVEEVAERPDWESLGILERELIRDLKTLSPNGYNMSYGGDGMAGAKFSYRTRAKMRAANKAKTAEVQAKISAALKGKPWPEARRAAHNAKRAARQAVWEGEATPLH